MGDNVTFFIEFNNDYPSCNIHVYVAGTERLNETVAFEQLSGTVAFGGDQAKFDSVKVGYDNNTDHDLDDAGDTLMVSEDFGSTDTTIVYDKAGNLIDDGSLQHFYDAWNRLVKVRSAKTGNATIQTAEFDGLGRRIKKVVTNSGEHDGTTVFYFDGQKTIETRDGSGYLVQQFIHGTRYIDELVQMRVKDKGDLYAHQDANWNVTALTDLGTSVVERYVYTPYGEITVHQDTSYGDRDGDSDVDSTDKGTVGSTCTGTVTGACRILDLDFDADYESTDATKFDALPQGLARHPGKASTGVNQPFAHQGDLYEPEISLYDKRARKYDASKGQFGQRDPNQYGDSMSGYTYLGMNPTRRLDPAGTQIVDPPGASVAHLDYSDPTSITVRLSVGFWGCGVTGTCGMPPPLVGGPSPPNFRGMLAPWEQSSYFVYSLGTRQARTVRFDLSARMNVFPVGDTTTECDYTSNFYIDDDTFGGSCAERVTSLGFDASAWIKDGSVAVPGGKPQDGCVLPAGGSSDTGVLLAPPGSPPHAYPSFRRCWACEEWALDPAYQLIAHEVGHLLAGPGHVGSDVFPEDIVPGPHVMTGSNGAPLVPCSIAARSLNYQRWLAGQTQPTWRCRPQILPVPMGRRY